MEYTVGGTVSGLAGSGLVLQNNGGDDLAIAADGSFTFATPLADGSNYAVTVLSQPGNLSQTCTVSNGNGTLAGANVTNVAVTCTTNAFTVGGTVSGLAGSGLVLQNNGSDDLAIAADGSFTFATPLADGSNYAVSVLTQPGNLSQTCTVSNGNGTLAGANVSNVAVTCTTNAFTVGGTVSGLAGSGLVLQNNGGDDLAIAADGAFTFATPLVDGSSYAVSVLTQPGNLSQTCSVSNGSGTLAGANVSNVAVICTTDTFTVGGTVSGLAGSGLVLQNNGSDDLAIAADGSFTFATPLVDGSNYVVSVLTQPGNLSQTCTVSNGSGTLAGANVSNVAVTCTTDTFTVGGTVSGLAGSGLVLQNNGGDDLPIAADGSFTFATALPDGSNYAVTVLTQPGTPSQTCTVSNGSGTLAGANVTNVVVACSTDTFTVGGTVSGLAGSGLVLQNNGGDNLPIAADGPFTFATALSDGSNYAVTVLTQPGSPTQTCSVSSGNGTLAGADVTNVAVTCTTDTFTVGGTVSGLAGSGLVLQNNGGDDLAIAADGVFTFATPLVDGSSYAVTVLTQPGNLSQTCTVSNGNGTIAGANVTSVVVTCSTDTFTVGGTVSGLSGSGLVLQNNSADSLVINANGAFTFATSLPDGSNYAVTVLTQPGSPTQTCSVSSGNGTLAGANVTSVVVTCSTDTFTVGGTVSGLSGSGLVLQNNGADNLAINANGAFTFATALADGSNYAVTALTQPGSPSQTCTVSNGSGTLAGANVTTVEVACANDPPGIDVSPTALNFGTVLLGNSATATVTVSNTGMGELVISQITAPEQPFSIIGGSCTAVPVTLQTGESCEITVQFAPGGAVGVYSGSFDIVSNSAGSPSTVVLSGSGQAAVMQIPTLDGPALWLLVLVLGMVGVLSLRRMG